MSEFQTKKNNGTLIRINLREPQISSQINKAIELPLKSLEALEAIQDYMKK